MTRCWFRLAPPCLVFFSAVLLLIHAQPYDDSQLRAFLTPPEGCPAPCFMGIRPGITTVRAGGEQLLHSASIEHVRTVSFQLYEVQFAGDTVPVRRARLYFLATPDIVVERINLFDSGLPLSRVFLAFGQPEHIVLHRTFRFNVVTLVIFYPQYALYVLVDLPLCAVTQTILWDNRLDVSLGIGLWRGEAEQPDYYLSAQDLDVRAWAAQLRAMKRAQCR